MFTAAQISDFDPSNYIEGYINFANSPWRKVQTLQNKLIQTIWMDVSQHTRYIALARTGFINLAEVEVFKSGNKISNSFGIRLLIYPSIHMISNIVVQVQVMVNSLLKMAKALVKGS